MRSLVVLAAIVSIAVAGCSKAEIQKNKISGQVKYNSQPVEKGEIRFIPKGDTKGPMASTAIANGNYVVNAAGGVPVGAHRVEIFAHVELPKPANAPPIAPTPRLQYIPDKYNTKSELEFVVEAGKASTADFDLDGPPPKQVTAK